MGKKAIKWEFGIVALLIITTAIVCFVFLFIQRQGPVNQLFGRLSPSTVSSISIRAIGSSVYPAKEIVLEEDDKNKLIGLLHKERYEGDDDPEFASWTGGPKPNYDIHIQTKDGADVWVTINPWYCICCPDELEGKATSKPEWKGYPVSKDRSDEHQQVMDFIAGLLSKHFAE